MRLFISGGAGFIAYHLQKKLEEQGHEVYSIDNFSHPSKAPHKAVEGDITNWIDLQYMSQRIASSDFVVHAAAQIHVDKSIKNPRETFETNVIGTMNILELCKQHKKKLIFASTSEVYGTSNQNKMDEAHPLRPQSPYAVSKLAADRLCYSYHKTFGTEAVIVRNFNTFGEWQNDGGYGGVIAIFTRQALAGEPITIYGDGEQERDYMYIDDAVQAYLLAIDAPGGVYNFGTGKTVKIKDLAKMIKEITGSTSEIVYLPARQGEVQRLCADTTKAEKVLGFKPTTDFERDLTKYVLWKKQNI